MLEIDEQEAFADENDRASMIELQNNQEALERARQLVSAETHPEFDGSHCVVCDAKIPKARLALMKVRCVECQSRIEAGSRMYRHQ